MMIWKAGPDAKCHYRNEEWLRFTGTPPTQQVAEPWGDNVHPEDLPRCRSIYQEQFRRRTPYELRYRLQRHDRVFRLVSDHATPLFDGDRFLGYFGACVDVQAELERGRERAVLTSNVAHDLRQPLSTLLLLVERMRRATGEDGAPPGTHQWNQVRRQIERCTWLVEELADISVLEQGQTLTLRNEVIQLTALLSGLVTSFNERERSGSANGRHDFVLEAPGPVLIRGDGRRIERVFLNLLENARKYSPLGGTIRVVIANLGPTVEILVSDPGMGMSPDTLVQLTRRFFRSESTGDIPGLGLGLSISRDLVDAHGGELRFDSTPGKGTTVIVRLPVEGRRS